MSTPDRPPEQIENPTLADMSKLSGVPGGTHLWEIIDQGKFPISTVEILDVACKHALAQADETAKIAMLSDALAANPGAMTRLGTLLLHINKNELGMLAPPAAEKLARFNRQLFDFLADVERGDYEPEEPSAAEIKEIAW